MPDVFTRKKRSEVMRAIRSTGNRDTELKFIKILRQAKITGWRRRFRLFGKPDFCFPKSKIAVFVDGCFWHGCPKHGRKPDSNADYWHSKLARNKARDLEVLRILRKNGWIPIRFWEHELKAPERITKKLAKRLMLDKTTAKES